jgi:hypothetical protein
MPLFEPAILARFVIRARGRQAVQSSLANEMAELREEQFAGDAKKRARTKWLHANGAEASFPCGVVHVEDDAVPVLVAHEDRFAFRSPWMAWQAGRRRREARKG